MTVSNCRWLDLVHKMDRSSDWEARVLSMCSFEESDYCCAAVAVE